MRKEEKHKLANELSLATAIKKNYTKKRKRRAIKFGTSETAMYRRLLITLIDNVDNMAYASLLPTERDSDASKEVPNVVFDDASQVGKVRFQLL